MTCNQKSFADVSLAIHTNDLIVGVYVLRPYTFFIDPVPASRSLKLERIWSFQSGGM